MTKFTTLQPKKEEKKTKQTILYCFLEKKEASLTKEHKNEQYIIIFIRINCGFIYYWDYNYKFIYSII